MALSRRWLSAACETVAVERGPAHCPQVGLLANDFGVVDRCPARVATGSHGRGLGDLRCRVTSTTGPPSSKWPAVRRVHSRTALDPECPEPRERRQPCRPPRHPSHGGAQVGRCVQESAARFEDRRIGGELFWRCNVVSVGYSVDQSRTRSLFRSAVMSSSSFDSVRLSGWGWAGPRPHQRSRSLGQKGTWTARRSPPGARPEIVRANRTASSSSCWPDVPADHAPPAGPVRCRL